MLLFGYDARHFVSVDMRAAARAVVMTALCFFDSCNKIFSGDFDRRSANMAASVDGALCVSLFIASCCEQAIAP